MVSQRLPILKLLPSRSIIFGDLAISSYAGLGRKATNSRTPPFFACIISSEPYGRKLKEINIKYEK